MVKLTINKLKLTKCEQEGKILGKCLKCVLIIKGILKSFYLKAI